MPKPLEGKTVVVGLTGGIACYKAAELVRALVRGGASVRVMMTAAAREFITPLTLQTLSGHPVATEIFNLTQESQIGHIHLADRADALIVAPATANCIGKIAGGLADDIVTTVILATKAPLLMAPSMNVNMYENVVVQENLERLRSRGVRIIEPGEGFLACGWEGKGRLADTEVLVAEVERAVTRRDLAGQRVLVTAGPNREAIDPVRFISNRSTGKMGFALAAAAWRRGAEVVLIAGPTSLATPHGVQRIDVASAADMHHAVRKNIGTATVLLMTAAVADYRPAHVAAQKLKKGSGDMQLDLVRTVDILADVAAHKGERIVVGFAAETEAVLENAQRKLEAKKLDLIVANDVAGSDTGFAVDTNAVTIIDRSGGREDVPLMTKGEVADRILDRVAASIHKPTAKRPARAPRAKFRTQRRSN
ncbi:MAG: bifunctional phosphopantothenoylcysteine decarboxylase/phosphopantothenate--cysteine ligase CoaBC [Deltaproteobacteria bacterium]|nr:bifunctional phosphopantothenoylcysteine decarboxylase/phosphopantothenate--cysteine ligase CoaBC [Deltaproteobacteria bacterium]